MILLIYNNIYNIIYNIVSNFPGFGGRKRNTYKQWSKGTRPERHMHTRCKLCILSAGCKFVIMLLKQLSSSLWIKSLENQLAPCWVTTCSRLVIKPEQAMRTHPSWLHGNQSAADLLQLVRLIWLHTLRQRCLFMLSLVG